MPVKNVDKERAKLKFDCRVPHREDLSPAQQELLRDMRASLKQMKRGELLPAREALEELDLELEADDNARFSDA